MVRKTFIARFLNFIFSFFILSQFSCSKSEHAPDRSKFNILTSYKWKVKALYFRDSNEPVSANVAAGYFSYKPCEIDDIYLFKKDSTFSRLDSLDTCSSIDLDPFHINVFGPYGNSNWAPNSTFTQIHVYSAFYSYNWKILNLNEAEFSVEDNQRDLFGGEHTYTYMFQPAIK